MGGFEDHFVNFPDPAARDDLSDYTTISGNASAVVFGLVLFGIMILSLAARTLSSLALPSTPRYEGYSRENTKFVCRSHQAKFPD